ncbi:Aste57867_1585 [Aphanomyces stellatus]|uniref:Aste57867_1585 protein n=1 Tax=Aphanomyces stellatus TaxID=120398 RepID=A0A485K609_9STRA|nr:hypothetical protein As57867_001584 [Aphanomyces stellatus]VFT78798.1 Aste57867_1585 [Aphanomyces stellatus]
MVHKWAINGLRIGAGAYCVKLYLLDILLGMGPSMNPTLPDGVIILVDKLSLRWRPLAVGDVVVGASPVNAQGSMCKRIIAMEGQYVKRRPRFETDADEIVEVPKGHVWVEGDNPTASIDSRHYGPIPQALIWGRVTYKVWPLAEIAPVV